jgi:segregation and condensation protein A
MVMAQVAVPSLDDVQLRLPVFEGPLDVLLRLIEREQLEISEVSLLTVFDQFMAFTRALASPSPLVIAEFAAVAGRLSVLKSRALLPRPPRPPEEVDETDLVRQLAEYRAIKAAAAVLADRQRAGSGAYGRGESVVAPDPAPAFIAPQPPGALAIAVRRWFTRRPLMPETLAARPLLSVREMIARISATLLERDPTTFDRVAAACPSRHEIAVAFLALLILIRRQSIVAVQNELFGSIELSTSPGRADAVPAPRRVAADASDV